MELVNRMRRFFTFGHEAKVEFDARCLVQKLAREEAAIRAVRVARLLGESTREQLVSMDRRVRNARILRDIAEVHLRRELGLTEAPTALEIADWGLPPGRADRPDLRQHQ
jgi:hypothetical protein